MNAQTKLIVLSLLALYLGLLFGEIRTFRADQGLAFFALLGAVFSRLGIPLQFGRLTMGFVAHIAAALALPPATAGAVGALGYLGTGGFNPWKEAFNRAQLGLAAFLASTANQVAGPLAGGAVYFLTNLGALTLLGVALGKPPAVLWSENFRAFLPSYLGLFPVSLTVSALYRHPLVTPWGGADALIALFPVVYVYFLWVHQVRLVNAVRNIVEASVRYLEAKDPYTAYHSERVAAIARDIALEMGLPPDQVRTVELGARLHDIGKVKVPDPVLKKERGLSKEEWDTIAKHPLYGVELLRPLESFLGEVFPVVLYHHERWDGRGYPEGKAGYEIPLTARIVAVADAYEAMTSDRPYRRAKSPEEALKEIQDFAGTQFDPRVVEAFIRVWEKNPVWKKKNEYLKTTLA